MGRAREGWSIWKEGLVFVKALGRKVYPGRKDPRAIRSSFFSKRIFNLEMDTSGNGQFHLFILILCAKMQWPYFKRDSMGDLEVGLNGGLGKVGRTLN